MSLGESLAPKRHEVVVFPQPEYGRNLEYDGSTGKLTGITFSNFSEVDLRQLPADEIVPDTELLKTAFRFKGDSSAH